MKANWFTRALAQAGKDIAEKSPIILTVGGIAAGVATVVLASKETIKAQGDFQVVKQEFNDIDKAHSDGKDATGNEYTNDDYKKDLFVASTHGVKAFVKNYWPAMATGALSVTMILAGHNILNKRYVAAVGAYTALSDTFNDYRKRVAEAVGEEKEKDIRYNRKHNEVVEMKEDGTTKTTNEIGYAPEEYINGTERYFHGDRYDANGNFVDSCTPGFDSSINGALQNYDLLTRKEEYLNQLLMAKGYVTLNEAYKELGFMPTEEGQILGWRWDKENTHKIDLGIHNLLDEANKAFAEGRSPDILLTFNCDEEPLVHFRKSHKERATKTLLGGNSPAVETL